MRQPKRMAGPAQLTATAATKYTAPSLTPGAKVTWLHFFNADTVARTVTVSIGTDAAGTRIYDAYSIAAGTPYSVPCGHVLNSAEIIQAFADVASKVTLTINGEEVIVG